MNLDWNWFYSALAQSAAALIGVFGAFLISFLMRLQQEFSSLTKQLRASLNNRDKLHQEINQFNFEWYNENYEKSYLDTIARLVYDEELESTPEELYEPDKFSPFQDKTTSIKKIEKRIETAEQQLQSYLEKEREHRKSTDLISRPPEHPRNNLMTRAIRNKNYQMMKDFKKKTFTKFTALEFTLREIDQFLNDAEKFESMRNLLRGSAVLSLIIFFSCVIYPLSFLPVVMSETITFDELTISAFWNNLASLRGGFLAILSIIIALGVGYVIKTVNNIDVHKNFEIDLQKSTDIQEQPVWYQNYHQANK